jgi:hypothetical protein
MHARSSRTRGARRRSSAPAERQSRRSGHSPDATEKGGDDGRQGRDQSVDRFEDAERVTVAFLVAGGALEQGRQVAMFLTKEAVWIALPGVADAVACDGYPPLARLFQQFAEGGGELLVCPICFNSKKLDEG